MYKLLKNCAERPLNVSKPNGQVYSAIFKYILVFFHLLDIDGRRLE